ncbi:MAG: toll/interleukin-1 receptor domain-containing protein [Calothrix sp. FI2-JRJ7]|jgi:hypothetical protein|nr:toll/interleukin-1 receptor domain-containing protein [Calothrix sp. FI2-JRJ7]
MQSSVKSKDYENFTFDAFISYSSRDRDWVNDKLLTALETGGLKACIDYRDFEIGVPTLTNIEQAVEKSRKTLLVLTPSWLNSQWTNFETLLVQTSDPAAQARRILPLMVIKTELPKRLEMLTYLDLTDPGEFDLQLRRLINNINNTCGVQEISRQESDVRPTSTKASNRAYDIGGDFNYLQGLAVMKKQLLTVDIDTRLAFESLNARLQENIRDEKLFGSSETVRNERNRIVYQLNRFGLIHLDNTFNEMCGA